MDMGCVNGTTSTLTIEHRATAIINLVEYMIFAKKGKGPEKSRAVERVELLLHLCEGEGVVECLNLSQHHKPYCCGSYTRPA